MEKPTSPSSCSLQITRNYSASQEAVFQVWTDPKALIQWFAPSDSFTTPLAEVNLSVGGSYRIHMKDPPGEMHTVGGEYREICRPNDSCSRGSGKEVEVVMEKLRCKFLRHSAQ